MKLQNSTILITGGTSGIGLELLRQLSKQGVAQLIVTGRDSAKLSAIKQQFPHVYTVQNNVNNPLEIKKLYKEVTHRFPELNIIINNAGIMRNLDLQDSTMDLDNITAEVDTNLSGTIRMVHQFLPHLRAQKSAAIVNISSGLAFIPFPLSPIYSATKSGIHAYTKVLRLQLKKTSIKVFELAPPSTETPLQNAFSGFDLEKSAPMMKVDKMVELAIKGILNDRYEMLPGMAKMMKIMGRIAPNFFLNFMDKTIEKAKRK